MNGAHVFETDHRHARRLPHHTHTTPFATIVTEGGYVEVVGHDPAHHAAGTLVLHPAGEEHADHFVQPTRCLNVEIPDLPANTAFGRVPLDDALERAISDTLKAFEARDQRTLATLVTTFASLVARPRAAALYPEWLTRALADFSWIEPISFEHAASYVGVHPVHFSRDFQRHLGMTPSAYRRRERARLASRLLLKTELSLVRIGQQCGFADQSHFTRAFNALLGLTPAKYRRSFER